MKTKLRIGRTYYDKSLRDCFYIELYCNDRGDIIRYTSSVKRDDVFSRLDMYRYLYDLSNSSSRNISSDPQYSHLIKNDFGDVLSLDIDSIRFSYFDLNRTRFMAQLEEIKE